MSLAGEGRNGKDGWEKGSPRIESQAHPAWAGLAAVDSQHSVAE